MLFDQVELSKLIQNVGDDQCILNFAKYVRLFLFHKCCRFLGCVGKVIGNDV